MIVSRLQPYLLACFFTLFMIGLYQIPAGGSLTTPVREGHYVWNVPSSGWVSLDGEWLFCRNSFSPDRREEELINVPDSWDYHFGYGTYRISITGLDPKRSYSFLLPYEATAYDFYVDGVLLYSNGVPGVDRASTTPAYAPGQIIIPPGKDEMEVAFRIANFHHRRGGLFQRILLGSPEVLKEWEIKGILSDGALLVTYLTMCFSLTVLFLIRREHSIALLALFFLFSGINNILGTPNVLLFRLFPRFPWFLYQKLCYYVSYLMALSLLLFAHTLYGVISKQALLTLSVIYGVILLFVTVTPPQVFTLYNSAFQLYTVFVTGLILAIFFRAVRLRLPGAGAILIGHLILVFVMFSSILFSNNRISGGTYLPLSFLEYYRVGMTGAFSLTLNTLSYLLILLVINLLGMVFFVRTPALRVQFDPRNIEEEAIEDWSKPFSLSPREQEIVLWLLRGKSNKEICDGLFISLSTVKTHVSRIFKKTGVASRSELFFHYQRNLKP